MNQELAQIYGNAPDEDAEKLASAQLAEGLQGDGSVTSNLTDEQIEQLAAEVVGGGETAEKVAGQEEGAGGEGGGGSEEELSDDAKQKLAEADYLGRVMAHAFAAERRDIEKVAGAGSFFERAGGAVARADPSRLLPGAKASTRAKGAAGKVGEHLQRHGKKYTAGAAGSTGFALGRKSKGKEQSKHSSATPNLDALAQARAAEILQANGIDPNAAANDTGGGEKTAQTETGADDQEQKAAVLAQAVENRALQLLKDQGYEITTE